MSGAQKGNRVTRAKSYAWTSCGNPTALDRNLIRVSQPLGDRDTYKAVDQPSSAVDDLPLFYRYRRVLGGR